MLIPDVVVAAIYACTYAFIHLEVEHVGSFDGLAVLTGLAIGLIWVALLVGFTLFFGAEGLDILKDMIKSLL